MNLHDDGRGALMRLAPEVHCERELQPARSPWFHYIAAVIELVLFMAGWAGLVAAVRVLTQP